jgi:putative restriction endonuclease
VPAANWAPSILSDSFQAKSAAFRTQVESRSARVLRQPGAPRDRAIIGSIADAGCTLGGVLTPERLSKRLAKLRVDRSHGDPAPHKPLMLLAVLDLIEERVITDARVEYGDRLVERFHDYWSALDPTGFQPRSWLPYFHLRSDGFWQVVAHDGLEPELAATSSPKSRRQLQSLIRHVRLSDEVWASLQSEQGRDIARRALLESHFAPRDQDSLSRVIELGTQVARCAENLLDAARHSPFRTDHDRADVALVSQHVRGQAFRKVIRRLYRDSCSMCELRLVTDRGRSIMEAAHIIPFAESHNDDPRNGIALCPVHHWCFDQGLTGITPDYRIVVAEELTEDLPTNDRILALRGRSLRLPNDELLYPHRSALERHLRAHALAG